MFGLSLIHILYVRIEELHFHTVKDALASQPTVSRFFNRMDEDTLNQLLTIGRILRKKIYSIQLPQAVILDLDFTLLDAYGRQAVSYTHLEAGGSVKAQDEP